MCLYVCANVCFGAYLCVFVRACVFLYVFVCYGAYLCVFVRVCVFVCVYVCVCVLLLSCRLLLNLLVQRGVAVYKA